MIVIINTTIEVFQQRLLKIKLIRLQPKKQEVDTAIHEQHHDSQAQFSTREMCENNLKDKT